MVPNETFNGVAKTYGSEKSEKGDVLKLKYKLSDAPARKVSVEQLNKEIRDVLKK